MPAVLRSFSPVEAVLGLTDVPPSSLAAEGKRLVLLDVDNTVLPRDRDDVEDRIAAWVRECQAHGLEVCFISNTRRFERLAKIAESLGAGWVRGRNKPSRAMFRQALDRYGCRPSEAVMIGDQLLTDVLGANRAGIDAVWVDRMDGAEFIGTTVISRNVERVLALALQQFFHADEALTEGRPGKTGLLASPGFRQFIKFGLVGAMSFVINYSIVMTLMYGLPGFRDAIGSWVMSALGSAAFWAIDPATGRPDASHAALPVAGVFGSIFGILNSFFWNRRWTFRILGAKDRAVQFRRFVLLSATGAALDIVLTQIFFGLIHLDERDSARIAKVAATILVAFWNFFGQKLYAFRRK
jgi:HAD superfamily phosphatase (TIGR01668 family)